MTSGVDCERKLKEMQEKNNNLRVTFVFFKDLLVQLFVSQYFTSLVGVLNSSLLWNVLSTEVFSLFWFRLFISLLFESENID